MKNLDLHTYGKTPACIYLAYQLTQLGDQRLASRIGQSLTAFRELTRSLEKSNDAKTMTQHNVSSFAELLRVVADEQYEKYALKNKLIADLVRNIMIGELKSLLRRSNDAKHSFKTLQRRMSNLPGPTMSALMETLRPKVTDFEDDINADTLTNKSLAKLDRKGKISTLY